VAPQAAAATAVTGFVSDRDVGRNAYRVSRLWVIRQLVGVCLSESPVTGYVVHGSLTGRPCCNGLPGECAAFVTCKQHGLMHNSKAESCWLN
jgi:hypothetical protein